MMRFAERVHAASAHGSYHPLSCSLDEIIEPFSCAVYSEKSRAWRRAGRFRLSAAHGSPHRASFAPRMKHAFETKRLSLEFNKLGVTV